MILCSGYKKWGRSICINMEKSPQHRDCLKNKNPSHKAGLLCHNSKNKQEQNHYHIFVYVSISVSKYRGKVWIINSGLLWQSRNQHWEGESFTWPLLLILYPYIVGFYFYWNKCIYYLGDLKQKIKNMAFRICNCNRGKWKLPYLFDFILPHH